MRPLITHVLKSGSRFRKQQVLDIAKIRDIEHLRVGKNRYELYITYRMDNHPVVGEYDASIITRYKTKDDCIREVNAIEKKQDKLWDYISRGLMN